MENSCIPHNWITSTKLRTQKGGTNFLAIFILSSIIKSINQDNTKSRINHTYQSWADMFGYSKRSVQEACYFLKKQGLINIEIRHRVCVDIIDESKVIADNIVYFEPIFKNIEQLSSPQNQIASISERPKCGYVYLAYDFRTKYTKIGFSNNPNIREKTLQSENPLIEIFLIIKQEKSQEKEYHDYFEEQRIRGEWFRLSSKDVKYIFENKCSDKESAIRLENYHRVMEDILKNE